MCRHNDKIGVVSFCIFNYFMSSRTHNNLTTHIQAFFRKSLLYIIQIVLIQFLKIGCYVFYMLFPCQGHTCLRVISCDERRFTNTEQNYFVQFSASLFCQSFDVRQH